MMIVCAVFPVIWWLQSSFITAACKLTTSSMVHVHSPAVLSAIGQLCVAARQPGCNVVIKQKAKHVKYHLHRRRKQNLTDLVSTLIQFLRAIQLRQGRI